jgi:uncharacterized protein (DUF302 family)
MSDYGYSVEVPAAYDEAVVRARLALRGEGFSILSEMHVGGMLGPDAGSERQYLIMGSWDSRVEGRRIGNDVRVSFHLPCNLVVQESGQGSVIAALDPVDALGPGDAEMLAATEQVREALERVLVRVAEVPGR